MKVKIELFRWEGKRWGFEIKTECEECDILTALLKDMQKEFRDKDVTVEIKPWLNHAGYSLIRGGWHPPVLMVNGRVFSQGIVPKRSSLNNHVKKLLVE